MNSRKTNECKMRENNVVHTSETETEKRTLGHPKHEQCLPKCEPMPPKNPNQNANQLLPKRIPMATKCKPVAPKMRPISNEREPTKMRH